MAFRPRRDTCSATVCGKPAPLRNGCCLLPLLPLLDAVAAEPHLRRPEAVGEAGLPPQVVEEIAGGGELPPDVRREGAPVPAVLEDDAVDPRPQEAERLGLARGGERLRRR